MRRFLKILVAAVEMLRYIFVRHMNLRSTIAKIVRRMTRWAWREFLWDVARAEWKFGRRDDGFLIHWDEWNNIRQHLKESESLKPL